MCSFWYCFYPYLLSTIYLHHHLNQHKSYWLILSFSLPLFFQQCIIIEEENKKLFIPHLYLILKIILIHALINFFIFPFVKPFLINISNGRYDCVSFLNVFFYLKNTHSFSVLGIELVRNQGIFWEPGVLQIFLNLLLFIISFVKKKRGLIFWLTILAIFTTFSTTGLVVLFVQLLLSFSSEIRKNILFLPIAVFMTLLVYYITSINISDKIHGTGQFSFQARFFDLVQPFYMLAENPITGVGLDDEQFIKTRQKTNFSLNLQAVDFSNVNDKGSTNSIMFFLGCCRNTIYLNSFSDVILSEPCS